MSHFNDETLDPRTAKKVRDRPLGLALVSVAAEILVPQFFPVLSALKIGRHHECDIALDDPRASRLHSEVRPRTDALVLKSESRFGTKVNGQLELKERTLGAGDVLQIGESFFVVVRGITDDPEGALVGFSDVIADVRSLISSVGRQKATVLIHGESGVGKELVAREIHRCSARTGAFVAINCAAIPEQLAESTLFGHRAGAFTGATRDHVGVFQQAEGGTLFLDEVGELSSDLQAKLLRVLDAPVVRRVGDTKDIRVDCRVVAATHRSLGSHVENGLFRGDLFARLSGLRVEVGSLRSRREDILSLLHHALDSVGRADFSFEPALLERLLIYPWPYNVRELMQLAKNLCLQPAGSELLLQSVVERLPMVDAEATEQSSGRSIGRAPTRDEVEALLVEHRGKVADVARATGRSRQQVYRWLEQYKLDAKSFRR